MSRKWVVLLGLSLLGCTEETGSGLVEFEAFAGGPKRKDADAPFEFDTDAGYHVTLERAQLTIGALYLNRARPVLGAQDTACVLPGLYAAEIRTGVVIDALSPELVRFDGTGVGTADRALTGEVWLTGGEIDAEKDGTQILSFAGTATRAGETYDFSGVTTISQNRVISSSDPATPGANPLCKQRIVSPIPIDITPKEGGRLELRVAPKVWFEQVDFALLQEAVAGAASEAAVVEIPDTREDAVSSALLQGLRSATAYDFDWTD